MRPTISICITCPTATGAIFSIKPRSVPVTLSYGLECSDNEDYFIDRCNYDQAGIILQNIYGALRARNDDKRLGELLTFDQREFTLL
jgi:hypothetical protein